MNRNKNHILIVNDDNVTTYFIQSILEKNCYMVKSARSVSEALKILGETDIGTIILDYTLDGINTGYELIEKLKKYNIHVAIYASSSSEENNDKMYSLGISGILPLKAHDIKLQFQPVEE